MVLVNKVEIIFSQGSRYYKGGFEPKMTKREAALILGIRLLALKSFT